MAGGGNGCPSHAQLKPAGVQELTHTTLRALACGDRGVPQGDKLGAGDGN